MLKPLAKISIATMDQSTLQPPVASLMPIVIQWRLGAKRPQSSRRLVGVRDFKFLVCLVQKWASLAGRYLRLLVRDAPFKEAQLPFFCKNICTLI